MRVVQRDEIQRLLPRAEAREVIQAVFGERSVEVPPRAHHAVGAGTLLLMPSWSSEFAGVKLVGVVPGNQALGLPTVHALYVLLDAQSLAPIAILDGDALTELRTAAVSALATSLLARPDSRHLVMFGAGTQAREHLHALHEVLALERFTVVSRTAARADALVDDARRLGLIADRAEPESVGTADVVCTCTTSATPVFDGDLLAPGTHVTAVGAFRPNEREVDSAVVRRARVFVETRAAALAEAGDLVIPITEGAVGQDPIAGDLGDLVRQRVAGRVSPTDITLFKSVGVAFEDLAVASEIYRRGAAGASP